MIRCAGFKSGLVVQSSMQMMPVLLVTTGRKVHVLVPWPMFQTSGTCQQPRGLPALNLGGQNAFDIILR